MRVYDPRLGRFLSVDPLTQEYPWYTPYQFAGNTPIQAIDLDGLEEWMMQQEFALRQRVQIKIASADQLAAARVGTIKERKPNWAEKVKNFSQTIKYLPGGAGTSLFIDIAYGVADEAKITYTSAVYGHKHARGLDNLQVTDYKTRVGAGLNTLTGAITGLLGVEMAAAKNMLPKGIESVQKFDEITNAIRSASGVNDAEAGIRGSRVSGTSFSTGEPVKATADFDFFVVSDDLFNEAIKAGAKAKDGALRVSATLKFPALAELEKTLTKQLGEKVSIRIFNNEGLEKVLKKAGDYLIGGSKPVK